MRGFGKSISRTAGISACVLIVGALGVGRSGGASASQFVEPGATLIGFAQLPPDTFSAGPPSGVFRDNGRRGTGFPSQPVQGASAIWPDPTHPNSWLVLADNGYGVRLNSPDFLLSLYRLHPAWKGTEGGDGMVRVETITRFSDPNRHAPFRLVREDTPERWLTGGDFDPESFVRMRDGTFWVGDELGPFLLHVDTDGRLLGPPVGQADLVSPDRPGASTPDAAAPNTFSVRRSRGFEGLAASQDGSRLFAMLEGPTTLDPADQARILEFDPVAGAFTGTEWRFKFEVAGHSATELVAYAPNRFLVIERDGGHGPGARFKRVFAIQLGKPGEVVEKVEVANLMNIADPGRLGGTQAVFTFPFLTTEALWPESDRTLVLVNDNNFPATGGRVKDQRDGTEFIRLRLNRPLPR